MCCCCIGRFARRSCTASFPPLTRDWMTVALLLIPLLSAVTISAVVQMGMSGYVSLFSETWSSACGSPYIRRNFGCVAGHHAVLPDQNQVPTVTPETRSGKHPMYPRRLWYNSTHIYFPQNDQKLPAHSFLLVISKVPTLQSQRPYSPDVLHPEALEAFCLQ
jgi:hypothetical protein